MHLKIKIIAVGLCFLLQGISYAEASTPAEPTTSSEKTRVQDAKPIEIMVLGVDHLYQLYQQSKSSDVLSEKKQRELKRLRHDLEKFAPQQIMLEVDQKDQAALTKEYQQFLAGNLDLASLEYGRSERYQIGFRMGKALGLKDMYAADFYEGMPQMAFAKGENLEIFLNGMKRLQQTVRPLSQQVKQDKISLYDYLTVMNTPEAVRFTHGIIFNLPAYVTHGDFREEVKEKIDFGRINTAYIGAQYIGRFYQRNLNIYSNILSGQQQSQAQRVLAIFGQLHVGVLQELLQHNPAYSVVSPLRYLDGHGAEALNADFTLSQP
ncbi:hypothetical protein TDB9533_02431 [Thalassocella blandensis]|nr:hypothetical protein TDB9533_02431 [Thalassocella blandensis]